jgi:O-succinylbenzoic acid--CoA ligase
MKNYSSKSFFDFSGRKDLAAIIKSDSTISYKKLFDNSKKIASGLKDFGIRKNDYVPLFIEDPVKFIESTIALWYLRAIPVPLNTRLLDEEIIYLVDDYKFGFIICDRQILEFTKEVQIISLEKMQFGDPKNYKQFSPSLDNEAVIIFTSGSSERPKGVVHTFYSLTNNIQNGNQILHHVEKDLWLASLPFYHIGGFQIICRSFYYGCSLIIPESFQTNDLTNAILNFKPTHISFVSTQLEKLLNQKIMPDKSLKVSLIGGGFVDDSLIFAADQTGWNPIRSYGSSETGSFITAIRANEIENKPQSVGKTFNSNEIKITDDSEILIKSNCLFKNYLDDPKETASRLLNGFYHTGDLGFLDNDEYLFIEARRNDLIVTGGENVNPIEVEKALLKLSFIKDACVFAKQNKTWGQIVAAAIVSTDFSIDEKTIKNMLKQLLASYKIPKQFFLTNELPRTALGKLERDKIRKSF